MSDRKKSPEQWAQELNFAAIEHQHGLPAGVLTNLVRQESGGNADITSPAGAHGLCQIMPKTAEMLHCNASDPASAIQGAARYLEMMMDRYDGDADKAIAAYNCGPGNVDKALRKGGANWRDFLPNETKHYLEVVGHGITASNLTPEEETERRKREYLDLGGDPNNPMLQGGDIMTSLFFALMQPLIEKFLDKVGLEKPGEVPYERQVRDAKGNLVTSIPSEMDQSRTQPPSQPQGNNLPTSVSGGASLTDGASVPSQSVPRVASARQPGSSVA